MLTKTQERKIRKLVNASRCPVWLIKGKDFGPRVLGSRGYSEFKNGGECKYPGAAMRAGYKVKYIRSTLHVEIGDGWLPLISEDVPQKVRHLPAALLRWQNGTVLALARQERTDYRIRPLLADALEDAGCTDSKLLQELRTLVRVA